MSRYWLTPVLDHAPLTFGADRLLCEPSQEFEQFRKLLHAVHPMLLPMFKANLLLSDDEDSCGSEEAVLDLESGDAVIFDGSPFEVSHCAEAFFDRILSAREAKQYLSQLPSGRSEIPLTSIRLYWYSQLIKWLDHGWEVILLREDGV